MLNNAKAKQEIESIRESQGGMLRPADVVRFAKNPSTELHKSFVWDNDEAAERYRLEQARKIIRVFVTTLPAKNKPVFTRAYVSLKSDRHETGGYRAIADVLSDADRKLQLVEEALSEMEAFQRKYFALAELAEVFEAIDKVRDSIKKPKGRKPPQPPQDDDRPQPTA